MRERKSREVEKIEFIEEGAVFTSRKPERKSKVNQKQNGRDIQKKAFTLSEVLIALTVIGVIAALTVPALVQKTQKQEFVSALQKAYSTLSQAANMIIAEHGSPRADQEGWASSGQNIYNMYKKYTAGTKECGTGTECLTQLETGKGFKYLNSNSTLNWYNSDPSRYKLVLADGTQVMFGYYRSDCQQTNWGSNKYCAEILVDVNGNKKPNTLGRDAFAFVVRENGLFPAGCGYEACVNSSGIGCACKVLREGAMNY